jgi:protoheme IX farnesyltransferase
MAPLVWGEVETRRQMFFYTAVLLCLTLVPWAFGAFGAVYLLCAVVLGAVLLRSVMRVTLTSDYAKPAWSLYKFSLLYLALLFTAMAVDPLVG